MPAPPWLGDAAPVGVGDTPVPPSKAQTLVSPVRAGYETLKLPPLLGSVTASELVLVPVWNSWRTATPEALVVSVSPLQQGYKPAPPSPVEKAGLMLEDTEAPATGLPELSRTCTVTLTFWRTTS